MPGFEECSAPGLLKILRHCAQAQVSDFLRSRQQKHCPEIPAIVRALNRYFVSVSAFESGEAAVAGIAKDGGRLLKRPADLLGPVGIGSKGNGDFFIMAPAQDLRGRVDRASRMGEPAGVDFNHEVMILDFGQNIIHFVKKTGWGMVSEFFTTSR